MAPIYDNGATLFPDVTHRLSEFESDETSFITERIEKYPASLITQYSDKRERSRRTNYYEVLGTYPEKYVELADSLKKFRDIPITDVIAYVVKATNHPLIPPSLKLFYTEIIIARYLHMIHRTFTRPSVDAAIMTAHHYYDFLWFIEVIKMNPRIMRVENIDRIRKAYIMYKDTAIGSYTMNMHLSVVSLIGL